MSTALITGITGQDGWYLAHYLHKQGLEVYGVSRSGSIPADLPFVHALPPVDISNQDAIVQILNRTRPDEIYHLAAQTSVGASWNDPATTVNVTGVGSVNLLEAVRLVQPATRVFLASSSEVFGSPISCPQDESFPIQPQTPYGAAKALAFHIGRMYRQKHGLYVSNGILYNHESPRRPPSFVFRKITQGAVRIARGEERQLRLGNLDAVRDWGFAGDYVRAMHLQLQCADPDDFVIATGETRSVRQLCEVAFTNVGLDYRDYVKSDAEFWRPAEPVPLAGNAGKAKEVLGWSPEVDFEELVRMLIDEE